VTTKYNSQLLESRSQKLDFFSNPTLPILVFGAVARMSLKDLLKTALSQDIAVHRLSV